METSEMPQTYNVGARSRFVTATAWLFIVLAACAGAAVLPLVAAAAWPPRAGLVLALATFACAVGVLVRLEWARRFFIGLLACAIAAGVGGLWLQHRLVRGLVDDTLQRTPLPPSAADLFGGFATATQALGFVITLVACALLAGVIRRLMSPAVRQEFA